MDIDKLILYGGIIPRSSCFGSLMDIDKLIPKNSPPTVPSSFGSLMDIDKLILSLYALQ